MQHVDTVEALLASMTLLDARYVPVRRESFGASMTRIELDTRSLRFGHMVFGGLWTVVGGDAICVLSMIVRGSTPITVNGVPMQHGFWHLGRFAADYRGLFGGSPSQTLARTTPGHRHARRWSAALNL